MPGPIKSVLRFALGVTVLWVGVRVLLAVTGAGIVADTLGMPVFEQWVLGVTMPVLVPLASFEALVAISAALDWREGKLHAVTRQQAWAAAHVTVFVRAWRRIVWSYQGAKVALKLRAEARAQAAEAKERRAYVVLDPSLPFDGQVLDVVDEAHKEAS